MPIELTEKQKESVAFNGRDLLVRGVPGSGKSVVLMHRALRFNMDAIKEHREVRIIILAYNRSLTQYMRSLVDLTAISPCMIDVSTIDKLSYDLFREISGDDHTRLISDADRTKYVESALQKHLEKTGKRHRFHDIDPEFWAEEFCWMKQKNLYSLAAYRASERSGRGGKIRMTRADREVAFELFHEYNKQLKYHGKMDKEDYYRFLVKHCDKIQEKYRYDYVLIDEAQDLSLMQLRFAKIMARRSLTIAADKAQKIYKTSFSWKELGIDIRGRGSKKLERPFRSTRQIVSLAASLAEANKELTTDSEEYSKPVIPEREGEVPVIIKCSSAAEEENMVVTLLRKIIDRKQSVGLLYRTIREKEKLKQWMHNAHLKFEEINKYNIWSLETPGIKLTTIHSAKGLEFDIVLLPKFQDSVIPNSYEIVGAEPAQKEEIENQERNLLYVAMTRAKEALFITYEGVPSRFLYDFHPDYYNYVDARGNKLPKPGSRVIHNSHFEVITETPKKINRGEGEPVAKSKGPKMEVEKSKGAEVKTTPVETRRISPIPTLGIEPLKPSKPTKAATKAKKLPDQSAIAKAMEKRIWDGTTFIAHEQDTGKVRKFTVDIHHYPKMKAFVGKTVGDCIALFMDVLVVDEIL